MDAVSQDEKKRAKRKLKLETRLDKIDLQHNESQGHVTNQETKKKVHKWMLRDEKSICEPDKKVKEGTLYHLASLEMLHL